MEILERVTITTKRSFVMHLHTYIAAFVTGRPNRRISKAAKI